MSSLLEWVSLTFVPGLGDAGIHSLVNYFGGAGKVLLATRKELIHGAGIKSDVADVKNTGGRAAGTITAAAFLKKFASDFRWAHLDIAGTAWRDQNRPYIPKGGTGVGVRLLVAFLQKLSEHSD